MSGKPEEKIDMQGKIFSYTNYTNEELIFDIIKKHKPGWEKAYNQLMENTLSFVVKYVSSRETIKSNREDIIQEIMFQIIRTERVYKYTGRGNCKWTSYLFKHIRRWYIDFKKKEAERRENEPAVFDDNKNMDVYEDKPFDVVYSKTETERLMKHITEREKQVLELIYYRRLKKQKDIALRLDISEGRVSELVSSIRKKYRKISKDEAPEVQA